MSEITYMYLHERKNEILNEIESIENRYEDMVLSDNEKIQYDKMIARRYGQIDILDSLMDYMEEDIDKWSGD